jgi:nitrate reductase gamma subunit
VRYTAESRKRMLNPLLIQALSYASFLVFVVGSLLAVIRYASVPIHLRWELYPVAHEKGRNYGGSYLEDMDWWTKVRSRSLIGELKYMGREGLLFEQCYRRNRGLWYWTYPFHIGIFLIAFWLLLLVVGAATMLLEGPAVSGSSTAWNRLIFYTTIGAGGFGLSLSLIGCAGLLFKRVVGSDLRLYTVPADYLNLIVTLIVLLAGCFAWCFYDQTFAVAREYVGSLIGFMPAKPMNAVPSVAVMLFSLFLIYMPFSRMRHGLAKYFTYHRVRWEDEPNLRGSEVEQRIEQLLENRVTWAAPHIQQGRKWSELVKKAPTEQDKKAEGR